MLKTVLLGSLAALAALVCVPASVGQATHISFQDAPDHVFQGQRTTLHALVSPENASCRLSIKYKGGRLQRLQRKSAKRGRLSWSLRIPPVPAGAATATINCPGAGVATASLDIQWALQAPKVTIVRNGFSQRPRARSTDSDVSFGLEVHNERTRFDATNVTLLVNMVDATNRVLGTGFVRIQRLPASSVFYVGGQARIPTLTPVSRLEVVVSATSEVKVPATPPLISDQVIAPAPPILGPFVGSVRGQLLNQTRVPMATGVIGVVIEDANGNITGGGEGRANGPLSPGAREAFELSSTFSPIPLANASRALVSVIPTYRTY